MCLEDDHEEETCPACAEFLPKMLRTRRRQRAGHRAMSTQGASKVSDLGIELDSSDEENVEEAEMVGEMVRW